MTPRTRTATARTSTVRTSAARTSPARRAGGLAGRLASGLRRAAGTLGGLVASGGGLRGGDRGGGGRSGAAYSYAPVDDDRADPGEVVWAWVPYEEAPSRGKDRPVLVVGRDGTRLLALPLTSKDHDLDAAQEAAEGRFWVDIGSGPWDRARRPSEARVDRLLRLEPGALRRTGARLDREVFDAVLLEVRRHHPVP